MGFKGKVAIAFGLASAILIGVAVLSYRRMVQTENDESWVAHTHYVREELEEFLADLTEAEANQRGYILTDDSKYLSTYQDAVARLGKRIENIDDLTLDNPVQQIWLNQLEPLITARLTQMRRAVEAHRANGAAAGMAAVRDNNGGETMAKARTIIDAMSHEEDQLLTARTAGAHSTASGVRAPANAGAAHHERELDDQRNHRAVAKSDQRTD